MLQLQGMTANHCDTFLVTGYSYPLKC